MARQLALELMRVQIASLDQRLDAALASVRALRTVSGEVPAWED